MPDQPVPADIRALADARALARAGKDWAEADRLRADIEAAGWKVVDRGFSYALEPAYPPDVADERGMRYGRTDSVPSRLGEPPSGLATVVLITTDPSDDLARALRGLSTHAPDGTSIVVVADALSADQEATLDRLVEAAMADRRALPLEIVRTSARLGRAAALGIGVRRASAPVVIVLDPSLEPTGDLVTPLVAALDDPTVAIAGGWGTTTGDLRHFHAVPAGDVDVIDGRCQGFRREDAGARRPLDARIRSHRYLDTWWSLLLRDQGGGVPSRRAVIVADLPLASHEQGVEPDVTPDERPRLERRDFYRLIDRFGRRPDLLSGPDAAPERPDADHD